MTLAGDELATSLSDFARDLQKAATPDQVLHMIVQGALARVPGPDEGSVSMVVARHRVQAQAASGDLPREVDALQEQVRQGPCLDAVFQHRTVLVDDMSRETRWPRFSRPASLRGVGSMLSFQLYVEGDNVGALNLYALRPGSFTQESVRIGELFSAHAAVAYVGAQREAALERGFASRQLVGQAQGILMERRRMTADQAFEQLVQVSQDRNVKLHDVARGLVETGELATHKT